MKAVAENVIMSLLCYCWRVHYTTQMKALDKYIWSDLIWSDRQVHLICLRTVESFLWTGRNDHVPGKSYFMIRVCGNPIFMFPMTVYGRLLGTGGGVSCRTNNETHAKFTRATILIFKQVYLGFWATRNKRFLLGISIIYFL